MVCVRHREIIAIITNANAIGQRAAKFLENGDSGYPPENRGRVRMGWGRPSPHGLLLEDLLVEDDYGFAVGEQRLRPSEKLSEVSLDILWTKVWLSVARVRHTLMTQRSAKTILLSGFDSIPKTLIKFRPAFLFASETAERAKRVLDEYRKMDH